MKYIRFTIALIISALLSTGSTYTMLPSKKQLLAGMKMAIEVALGNVPRQRIDEISSKLPQLPEELLKKIRNLAIMGSSAQSLNELGYIINSLSQVNKDFNIYINDPVISLDIIKYLAHRFNSSYADACNALQTKAAKDLKEQLLVQDELLKFLLKNETEVLKIVETLNKLNKKNADFNFIYTQDQLTPLMQATIMTNAGLVAGLLELGADPTIPKADGITPLEMAKNMRNEEIIKLIENALARKK